MAQERLPFAVDIAPLGLADRHWGLKQQDYASGEENRYGQLTALARQVASIQGTDRPQLLNPQLLLFAADHGLVIESDPTRRALSAETVTAIGRNQQLVNALCRQNGFSMRLVNVGLAEPVDPALLVTHMSLQRGTQNLMEGPALTQPQLVRCVEMGRQIVTEAKRQGANVVAVGLVSRGARIAAAIWAQQLAGIPISQSINDEQLAEWTAGHCTIRKLTERIAANGRFTNTPEMLRHYGGFELVSAMGAMLQAASMRLTILVDNLPSLCALLAAAAFNPHVVDYTILAQMELTPAMTVLAQHLRIDPVLRLGLYASEGIGSLSAYSLIKGALHLPVQPDVQPAPQYTPLACL